MRSVKRFLVMLVVCVIGHPALAQDHNFRYPIEDIERRLDSEPFTIESAGLARPTIKNDLGLKATIAFPDGVKMDVKIRRAEPGGASFNNEPRYEMAAYEVQKLLLDPPDYVVPPTTIRALPLAELKKYQQNVEPTFNRSDDVIVVVQYWLDNVITPQNAFDADLAGRDPVYERRLANLNALTFLIEHKDANAGNVLASTNLKDLRLFSVDNGVAFQSLESDRGLIWREMRVNRLPAALVEKLRGTDRADLEPLFVLAQFKFENGRLVPTPPEAPANRKAGVRANSERVQFGLSLEDVRGLERKIKTLLREVDSGRIKTF